MQCDTPEALRFLASAAKTAEAHWMKAAADEIERLRLTDAEREAIEWAVQWITSSTPNGFCPPALPGLLERTK